MATKRNSVNSVNVLFTDDMVGKVFEFDSNPEQPGLSSSIHSEVMT